MSTAAISQFSAFSPSDSAFSAVNPPSEVPHTPHAPHTAHPLPLREQAFTLHCQGLRSPAIAQALGVPERTVRAWIAAALADLKEDIQLNRREQLLLAVERQHQFTAVCWEQFEREAAARDALLDAALEALHAAADSTADSADRPVNVRLNLPASTPAPRYLSLILQAGKEANRLLGLHTLARLQLLSPDPDLTESDIPAESATASANCEIAARTATASSATSEIPAESATALAATSDPECAAESATDTSLCPSASSVVNPPFPAESATDSSSPISPCPFVSSVSSVLNPRPPADGPAPCALVTPGCSLSVDDARPM